KILEEFDEFLVFFVRQEIVDYFLKALFQFEEIIFQPEPQKAFQKNTVIFPEKILDFLLNPGQAPLSPGFIQGGNNLVAEEPGFFLGKRSEERRVGKEGRARWLWNRSRGYRSMWYDGGL